MRDNQLRMLEEVERCFNQAMSSDGGNIALIEAPTGTGKSLAYLLAGILSAKKLNKKLVIATATKTLQSQLIEKDIPDLIRYSGLKFNYARALGRANYLCPYQLKLALHGVSVDMFDDNSYDLKQLNEIKDQFNANTWGGDLDSPPFHIAERLKSAITTDKDRCLAYSCEFNRRDESVCPFYLNKEQLKSSDVIVTNHSLLLADIILGSGSVLMLKPDDYLLCIDEGHSFVDNAINSFSKSFMLKTATLSCHNLAKLIYNPQNQTYLLTIDNTLCEELFTHAENLANDLEELHSLLRQNIALFADEEIILNEYLNPQLGTTFRDRFLSLAYIAGELHSSLDKAIEILKEQLKTKSDDMLEANINKLGFYLSVIENISITSTYIINQDESRYNANAKWISRKTISNQEEFIINAQVISVGDVLLNKLWTKVQSSLITSATLAVGDDFSYYLQRLGLNSLPKVATVKLTANFEYSKQAQIVVPRFKAAPEFSRMQEFSAELSQYLIKTLDYSEGFGTLVLFFNRKQLEEVYNMLPRGLQRNILAQIDYTSNQQLIKQHKANIDNGKPSIIFGLNSFAEGVDLPSLYCMHVIITKLPFATHKTPCNMVEEYWVKYEKGNYFLDVSLPEACIRLVQAAGRLIRSETDYGQLSICDSRLITKPYGVKLLNALPRFNRKYDSMFIEQAFSKIVGSSG